MQIDGTEVDEEESGRHDPVGYYGPWTWIIGFAFGAGIIWIMFALADGFN